MSQENSKTAPDLAHFPSLHAITTILHLLQQTTTTIVLPLCTPNLTIRRDIEKSANSTTSTLESKLSNILNLTLTASLNWVSRCLSQQKKTDFRPKEDDLMVTTETQACRDVSAFLTRVASQASAALSGRNLSLFLAELARGLRSLVLSHLLKFTISQVGGLSVSKDMNRYVELVRAWPTGDELEPGAMDVLTDVSTLFIIGPEALRDRLRAAGGQDAQELKGFIARRDDVGTVGVQSVLSGL